MMSSLDLPSAWAWKLVPIRCRSTGSAALRMSSTATLNRPSIAANAFAPEDEPWISMTGTSMASPYVAGVAGLMLSVNPMLTAAQIGGIIRRTARPLPSADFNWRTDAGFGRIDPVACLAEAQVINSRRDVMENAGGQS